MFAIPPKALDVEQIRAQLGKVLLAEQITSDARALQLLARAADGSMRDALSNRSGCINGARAGHDSNS